jgi:hypothetical protein
MMMSDIDRNTQSISTVNMRLGEVEDNVHMNDIATARIDENIKAIRSAVEIGRASCREMSTRV